MVTLECLRKDQWTARQNKGTNGIGLCLANELAISHIHWKYSCFDPQPGVNQWRFTFVPAPPLSWGNVRTCQLDSSTSVTGIFLAKSARNSLRTSSIVRWDRWRHQSPESPEDDTISSIDWRYGETMIGWQPPSQKFKSIDWNHDSQRDKTTKYLGKYRPIEGSTRSVAQKNNNMFVDQFPTSQLSITSWIKTTINSIPPISIPPPNGTLVLSFFLALVMKLGEHEPTCQTKMLYPLNLKVTWWTHVTS